MSKFLLLVTFVAAMLVSAAVAAPPGATIQPAAAQGELIHLVESKQKATRKRVTRKKLTRSFTRAQCDSQTSHNVCKFCQVTSDGYCRCVQLFPCE